MKKWWNKYSKKVFTAVAGIFGFGETPEPKVTVVKAGIDPNIFYLGIVAVGGLWILNR